MRYLRYPELREKKGIPFSRVHVDRLEKAGKFPRRVRLGTQTVAWLEESIDEWLRERAAESEAA